MGNYVTLLSRKCPAEWLRYYMHISYLEFPLLPNFKGTQNCEKGTQRGPKIVKGNPKGPKIVKEGGPKL